MNLSLIQRVYFVGIGGIGMSGLARFFNVQGKRVAGYDRTRTSLTDALEREGISVHFEENISLLREEVGDKPGDDVLIIYTPAIPASHAELMYLRERGFSIKKRSEVLGIITQNRFTIAVAGTHGKTTTSSIIAHILNRSGMGCTAFLGGISRNYDSNIILPPLSAAAHAPVVVEADEYDRSFLTLYPDVAVITSMDADHLDIYGKKEMMEESYRMFAAQVKPGGTLIAKKNLLLHTAFVSYAVNEKAAYYAEHIRTENGMYVFDLHGNNMHLRGLSLGLPGRHNVENAVAACAVAHRMQVKEEGIREALQSYQGVKRRFDVQLRTPSCVFIDDYAHHPAELKACILSVKELFPDKKITGIFQPHLFTRTRDFADEFAQSLSLLDTLMLLDIYPARELPIAGITSKIILDKVTIKDKMLCSKTAVFEEVARRKPELLLTLGAGDIDAMVNPLKEILHEGQV